MGVSLLDCSFLSSVKMPVRSNRRRVPSVKPAAAMRPLGTSPIEVPAILYHIIFAMSRYKNDTSCVRLCDIKK